MCIAPDSRCTCLRLRPGAGRLYRLPARTDPAVDAAEAQPVGGGVGDAGRRDGAAVAIAPCIYHAIVIY